MVQGLLIGIAAGIAAALLFVAPIGASVVAFPLFLLNGLPIAIVTLGWGVAGGVVATLVASALIGIIAPAVAPVLLFLALFAVPMVWLGRLAGMWREGDGGEPGAAREWYPTGRLLLHAALAGALGLLVIGIVLGYDPALIAAAAREALTLALTDFQPGAPPPSPESVQSFVDLYVSLLPFTLALSMVLISTVNLWLGALIARSSGRFARPRDRIWSVTLPNEALIGFAGAAILAFLPGPFGQVAGVFAGAFGCALVLVGLAVIHTVTAGMGGRAFLLGAMYIVIVFSGLPLILVAIVGAAESALQLRARRFPGGVPPT